MSIALHAELAAVEAAVDERVGPTRFVALSLP